MESKLYAIRVVGDSLSYTVILGTLTKVLPPLAALISILWIGFQFYHSEPMRLRRAKHQGEDNNGSI